MHIELQDIHKVFGDVQANRGISLAFEAGRIYGLLGENGAGKSTLMKILSGYQAPTRGGILLDRQPASFGSPLDALRRGVGMLYQDPLDFPPMRIVENYMLAYDNRLALDRVGGANRIAALGERFGFVVEPEAYVDNLTLGERQQIELLRLLGLGAEVLILDEPTTGISAKQKDTLFNTMRRLAREEHKTIILVSHKLEEVHELCDEVSVLRRGENVGSLALPCPTADLVKLMFGAEIKRQPRVKRAPGTVMLKLNEASVRTPQLHVDRLNLEVREGEVIGLAGLEGSGQQILLQAAAGLLPIRSGALLLDNQPLTGRPSPLSWLRWLAMVAAVLGPAWGLFRLISGRSNGLAAAGDITVALLAAGSIWLLGVVLSAMTSQSAYHDFQDRGGAYVPAGRLEEGLVAGLSLAEHMALVTGGKGLMVDQTAARQEIERRIKRFNIIGQADTLAGNLSGGNQQRAMLALLKSPLRLLLLEHPTRGLDITSADWMWELFQERRQEGSALIFISADLDELLERSDRIVVFFGGAVFEIVNATETTVEQLGHLIGGARL